MIGFGVAMAVIGNVWIATRAWRTKRARDAGHHPHLQFSVGKGQTTLQTKNDRLAVEILARNPSAWVTSRRAPKGTALVPVVVDEGAELAARLARETPVAPSILMQPRD